MGFSVETENQAPPSLHTTSYPAHQLQPAARPRHSHHDENPITTAQAALVPHRQQKQRLSEDMLQQMKCSHLVLPWKEQNPFSTEQKDEFTPKYGDTAVIQAANSHVSCVPLGTLKEFCSQRKVLFTP